MTDDDCFYVGSSKSGTSLYAGVAPQMYGNFIMGLYTDQSCIEPDQDSGYTFDDFGLYSNVDLGSGDDDTASWAEEWWQDTQEYTFTQLNDVYESFKYCTSCIDYPTYQDGYLIGDSGTDEDDLINQCWKFYSHDSYPCESDCVALAHSQGTILSVVLHDKMYGIPQDDFYYDSATRLQTSKASTSVESKFSRLLANVFVTFSFVVFVATFLAFAVARRSRYRESRSSKARRLLDDDDDGLSPRSKRSSRSKSKGRGEREGDGLFRGSSSRKPSRSQSRSKSKQQRSRSNRDDEYEPPRSSRRGRPAGDDF